MSDNALKDIYWLGDALEVVRKFAKARFRAMQRKK